MLKAIHYFSLISIVALVACSSQPQKEQNMSSTEASTSFNVMSFNIRYDNPGDSTHAWPNRKEMVRSVIQYHEADLLGMQEALEHQVKYLAESLDHMDWVGVGRDDGKTKGEFSPIFYNKSKFDLEDSGTFWLSETPDEISVGWDASMERIASWARLKHKQSAKTVFYLNTHFDHRGEKAREESAKLIRAKIKELAVDMPIIVTGDFNSFPESAAIQNMISDGELNDAFEVSEQPHHGATSSFSGFVVSNPMEVNRRIDYIFVSPEVKVKKHAILTDSRNNAYPSDHLPVIAKVSID